MKLMEISHIMKKEHYKEGDIIFSDGSIGDKLYMLFKGKVKVVKNNKIINL